MNKLFWKGRKVLLTGHTGFKGTWMSLLLEHLEARTYGYSLPVETASFYESVNPKVEVSIAADITDSVIVSNTIKNFEPEIVFHFAAHSSLQGSMEIPEYIFKTNMLGTLNVLEAARHSETIRAIVIITSDKCYLNCDKNEKYKEDSILWATDPYSSSKVCQELLSACYRDTFFQNQKKPIAITTARASNVIGPGDYNYARLFPYIFDCFVNKKIPEIRNPHAIRPWQYVLDVLNGYLLLAEQIFVNADITVEFNGAYNFGPTDDGFIDVRKVTEIVSQCFDNAPYKIISGQDQIPQEKKILMLDSTKAQNILNWHPKYSIEKTIKETAKFIKAEKNGHKTDVLARTMVAKYLS